MRNLLLFCLAAGLLAACTAPATQPPPPTPQVLTVALTPAVRTWQPSFYACAATLPDLRLWMEETPASRLDLQNGLALRLGAPVLAAPYFAAQIGEEQIVILVHPDNPITSLSAEALRRLYTGQMVTWDSLEAAFSQPVQAWSYPDSEELSQIFKAALWGSTPSPIQAFLAPDPAAMLEAVAATPGALGYLPRSWLADNALRSISVDKELAEGLRQPVLVLSAAEPQGLAQALVSCLQDAEK